MFDVVQNNFMEQKLEGYDIPKKESYKLVNKLVLYVVFFSLIGLIAEVIYGLIIKNIINSNVGTILGPLCLIYGVAGTAIAYVLKSLKGHKTKLFICGAALGIAIEYLLSFMIDAALSVKLWNYQNYLNGRVLLIHIVLFGIAGVLIVEVISQLVDLLIEKINNKLSRKIIIMMDIILISFFLITVILTIWGIHVYTVNVKDIYYEVKIFDEKNAIEKLGDKIFTNEKMAKLFPNIRFINENGNEVWFLDVIK